MGIAERKERDRREMQHLIIDAAKELFLTNGYEQVSIRAIAERIEYSPATIYLYFKDKDEILFALHNQGFEKLYRLQQAVQSTPDPLERLKKHGEAYLRFALENPEFYDLMFILRAPARTIVANHEWESGGRSLDCLRKNVQECMDAGVIPRSDVEMATFAMWSVVHGIVSLMLRDRCPMIPDEAREDVANGTFHYIMATMERLAAVS